MCRLKLIALIGQLWTGVFPGGRGISSVGLIRRPGHQMGGVDSLGGYGINYESSTVGSRHISGRPWKLAQFICFWMRGN